MDMKKTKKEVAENFEIKENITIVYTDGMEEHFKVIRIIDNGIIIGQMIEKEFSPTGFIPKQSYKKIDKGGKRKTKG